MIPTTTIITSTTTIQTSTTTIPKTTTTLTKTTTEIPKTTTIIPKTTTTQRTIEPATNLHSTSITTGINTSSNIKTTSFDNC